MFGHKWTLTPASTSILLLLSFATVAQQSTPTPRPEPTMGSITGRVVSDSGQPLANAVVFFRPLNGQALGRSTTTDNEGNFQINNLDAALYSISASLPTYVTPFRDPDAPPIFYRIGDTVRLDLVRGGVLTGTVLNAAGEPVIGLRVRSIMVRDASGKLTHGAILSLGERSTDDRGVYRIYGLAPGTYLIQAGGAISQFAASPYDLDAPTFSPSSNRDTAAEVIVRSGEESTADIRYRGEQGHVVSGIVNMRGTTGANVSLTRVGDGQMPTASSFQMGGTRGFAFYGVADGEYDVVAQEVVSALNQISPELAMSEARRITVKGSDVTGLELNPVPLSTLNGRFVLEPSKLPDCQGKKRPYFQETLVALARNQKEEADKEQSIYLRLFASSAFHDKDGVFALRNLRPGQYALSPKYFARYWYIQSISITSRAVKPATAAAKLDLGRSWATIKAGENVSGLTITLAEGAASIRGQLSVAEGTQPQSNLKVYLVPSERDKAEDAFRFFVAEVGGDGSFSFSNLPPGQYFISAQVPTDKDPQTVEKLRLPDASEVRARIRRVAEAAKLNIELKPCQNISNYQLPVNR